MTTTAEIINQDPRRQRAQAVLGRITEGSFTYDAGISNHFLEVVTGVSPDLLPISADIDKTSAFVLHYFRTQLYLRDRPRLQATAERDVQAAHLLLQGFPSKKIASSLLSMPETSVSKTDVRMYVNTMPKRMNAIFASIPGYRPADFAQMFANSVAGDPYPIPDPVRPSPHRFNMRGR